MGLFSGKKTSVDEVLSAFKSTIADLKEVETNNNLERDDQMKKAADATSAAVTADTESKRAVVVREKLEAIFA